MHTATNILHVQFIKRQKLTNLFSCLGSVNMDPMHRNVQYKIVWVIDGSNES